MPPIGKRRGAAELTDDHVHQRPAVKRRRRRCRGRAGGGAAPAAVAEVEPAAAACAPHGCPPEHVGTHCPLEHAASGTLGSATHPRRAGLGIKLASCHFQAWMALTRKAA